MLWPLLAGLFALNFTFTVFIVALPTGAGQFHTSVTVLTWTMVGPLLAYDLAAPILGRTGDLETVQQALVHRRGLVGAKPGPALLATFQLPFIIGASVGVLGLLAATFLRDVARDTALRGH